MSIDSCTKCGQWVDTDYVTEWYREEFNNDCLCDGCFEEKLEDMPVKVEGN